MVKKSAKKSTRRRKAQATKHPKKSRAGFWALISLLLVVIVVCVSLLWQQGKLKTLLNWHTDNTQAHRRHNQKHAKQHVPQFDFYTVLSQQQNAANANATSTAKPELMTAANPNVRAAKPPIHRSYFLQVAAFSHRTDAEQLRANLVLLGINAQLKKITAHHHVWFRVIGGPYANVQTAKADQVRLKRAHITSLLRQNPA